MDVIKMVFYGNVMQPGLQCHYKYVVEMLG